MGREMTVALAQTGPVPGDDPSDDIELHLVGAVDPDLRRYECLGNVGQHLAQTAGVG